MLLVLGACHNESSDDIAPRLDAKRAEPVHIKKNQKPVPTKTKAEKKINEKPKVIPPKRASMISQKSALPNKADHNPAPTQSKHASPKCPADMVNVADEFCVDRYEAAIFSEGRRMSPFYHPSQYHSKMLYDLWQTKFSEFSTAKGLTMPIPQPDAWQLISPFEVKAVSKAGVLPNGHANLRIAKEACEGAGKRVCGDDEWEKACKGERQTQFPYGDQYRQGVCNVFRFTHPIEVLHTEGHSGMNDPRLNMVHDANDAPLLERTGTRDRCASVWGKDAIYDMVGNLDEWVDDPNGRFRGGFYSRSTKSGCEMGISSHPSTYFDYSTGVRCCRDLLIRLVENPYED